VLVNLADTRTPRDVYVDGRLVDVVPYGNQVVLHPDAGVNHTVEWVSTLGGGTVDVVRVSIDTCATFTAHELLLTGQTSPRSGASIEVPVSGLSPVMSSILSP